MQTIGFTNKYYTLWEVSEPYKQYINAHDFYVKQDFTYIQNLSMDLEVAKSKIRGDFKIDITLCGHSSFYRSSPLQSDYPDYQFSFGKLAGTDIRLCNDVWQLNRAMNQENGLRRRVYARRRLIELGELIRFVHYKNEWVHEGSEESVLKPFKYNYATPSEIEWIEKEKELAQRKNGHFFKDGEKVELELTLRESFGFESQFGYQSVRIYTDSDNRVFKYVGSSPVHFDGTAKIRATIKHNYYNGEAETKLLRIKIME